MGKAVEKENYGMTIGQSGSSFRPFVGKDDRIVELVHLPDSPFRSRPENGKNGRFCPSLFEVLFVVRSLWMMLEIDGSTGNTSPRPGHRSAYPGPCRLRHARRTIIDPSGRPMHLLPSGEVPRELSVEHPVAAQSTHSGQATRRFNVVQTFPGLKR